MNTKLIDAHVLLKTAELKNGLSDIKKYRLVLRLNKNDVKKTRDYLILKQGFTLDEIKDIEKMVDHYKCCYQKSIGKNEDIDIYKSALKKCGNDTEKTRDYLIFEYGGFTPDEVKDIEEQHARE